MSEKHLESLGWDARWEELRLMMAPEGAPVARVLREDRGRYELMTEKGPRDGVCSGRYVHETASRADYPSVGDWIWGRADTEGPWLIQGLLPRRTQFSRKAVGGLTEEQVVAANVDRIFLVCGLPEDFNERRLERYLLLTWNAGASPVIVLNKIDRVDDVEAWRRRAGAVAFDLPVVLTSALDGRGLDELASFLEAGQTVALLGSSGVGKSALTNALLGATGEDEAAPTGKIRDGDGRGRHTTSHRQLHLLPGGAILMDTPGMRELQLWAEEDDVDAAFADVEALASSCRFGDCGHEAEPGCAVREAIDDGRLPLERFLSWAKLQREARRLSARRDERRRHDGQRRWKSMSKAIRQWRKLGPKSGDPRNRRD